MILDNLEAIRTRVENACRRVGRDASQVNVVAVAKKASLLDLTELLRSGQIRSIGENRVQEAQRKRQALRNRPEIPAVEWRMIGHLQSNKIGPAMGIFDTLDSLDSLALAEALEARLAQTDRTFPVLVQVKLSDRSTQHGVSSESLGEFLTACRRLRHIQVKGLMAIAPVLEPLEAVRPYFKRMRELRDRFFSRADLVELSMGMSRDFEVAIEEGATTVRLGTILFAHKRDNYCS